MHVYMYYRSHTEGEVVGDLSAKGTMYNMTTILCIPGKYFFFFSAAKFKRKHFVT